MSPRLKQWLGNLGLMAASLAVTALLLEHVVFRFILVPDDVLENVTINDVVRYQPGTRAVFRHPDGRESLVTINTGGWNSSKPVYEPARTPGRLRIAVVGDSYVHAAYVNTKDAFPERLERMLRRDGLDVEVLRFGMDGAPLSQYLHMLRREVVNYTPDLVIVPLIHNDFDEIYRFLKTRYESSFMKVKQDEAGRFVEVPPAEFKRGLADKLRHFRTFRYVYYETGLYLSLKGWVSRLFWGGEEEWRPEFISSAVDIRKINDHPRNKLFARYVMGEMKKLADERGFRLAFVMDGVREAIYEGRKPMDYEVGRLNKLAAELTAELGLPFLDLQDAFARDYAAAGQRLEYAYDWHWNERGNRIVAEAIAQFLLTDTRLISSFVKPVSGRQALAP